MNHRFTRRITTLRASMQDLLDDLEEAGHAEIVQDEIRDAIENIDDAVKRETNSYARHRDEATMVRFQNDEREDT